jgi:hypothetical protein
MKTAVEWLESEMLEHYSPFDNIILYTAIHKAKEMEKEQKKELIIATYTDLKMKDCQLPYGMQYHNELLKAGEESEQYYNKTFKQQEQ